VTSIGDLRPDEIEAAVALWEACDLTRPWNDPRADIRRAFDGATSTILAHREDGRLVATAMVGADGHRGWVYYLAVAPDRRKRGLGEAMMRAAEDWDAADGPDRKRRRRRFLPRHRLRNRRAAAAGQASGRGLSGKMDWSRTIVL
jgi:GNAT superfamily N-acetyltransferase